MRVFISSDIEGTCGITAWSETVYGNPDYAQYQLQMSKEVAAAAAGALDAGATRVVVRDAHNTARNIIPSMLPEEAFLSRGWRGDMHSMMSGIQLEKFDAAAFTGYHSGASFPDSPLSHTTNRDNEWIELNGQRMSEFLFNAHVAAYYGVPVVFLSGDAGICKEAKKWIPTITTVETHTGIGRGTIAPHPAVIERRMREAMKEALGGDVSACLMRLPDSFEIKVRYFEHASASYHAFYPGARQLDAKTVAFACNDFLDIMRFYQFCV